MKNKILFTYTIVGRGGDAVQVIALAEGFKAIGNQVALTGPFPVKPYEFGNTSGSLRNIARGFPWWARDIIEACFGLITFAKAKKALRSEEFNLIFHRAGIYDYVGSLLKRKSSLPLVIHLDAPFATERKYKGEPFFKFLHNFSMLNIGKHADLVVTMSKLSKDYYTSMGIPSHKILVLPNGISLKRIETGAALSCEHIPFINERIIIGFLGSLSRWHRVELLIDALKLLLERGRKDVFLVIVGQGEEYERLKQKAVNLGLEKHMEWTGFMPPDDAFGEIKRFDIAVLPHTLETGSPMKLFEYAAFARPVIAPDLNNISKLFEKDHEICLFQPESVEGLADALGKLCDEKEKAKAMGINMQKKVQIYTWESIVGSILNSVNENLLERLS